MQAGALSIKLMADIADVQRKMAQMQQLAQTASNGMASAFSGLGAKIAGALSVGAIAAFVKQTVDAIDAMNDLADATGASIEEISKLDQVARRNGQSLDQVGGMLVKFNAALKEADGKNGASIALQAIGLEAAKLRQTDPAEALRQTAVALAGFADDGNKARIVQELFGKSVRDAAPFLKDLAEAGELNASVTAQQAAEAEKFNKAIFQLQAQVNTLGRGILNDLLPTLTAIAQGFAAASQESDRYEQSSSALRVPLEALAILGANVAFVFQGVGREIGAWAAQIAALARGDLRGFTAISDMVKEDGRRASAELDAFEQRVLNAGKKVQQALQSTRQAAQPGLPDIVAEQARRKAADEAAIKAAKDRQTELDIQAKRQLANIAAYDKAEQELEEQLQRTLKAELDLAAARGLKAVAAYEAAEQAIDDSLAKARDLVKAINSETAALGMSNQEREIHNALLSLEAAGLQKGTYAYEEYARKIREAVVNRETVRASIEQTKTIEEEWRRTADQIGQSLTDALMTGGKSAWEYIKGLFRSMVLRPIVQAVVNPIVGATQAAVGSALGLSAGSAAAGSAFGNAAGAAIGSAIFGSSAAYGAAIGTTSVAAGSQAAMLAAQTGSFGAAGLTATSSAAAGAGSGFMATAAAAGPYVLAALAVLNAAGVFRSKKIVGGGLTGTLGEGDIQSYDLQRRGGTLFSGPDYSMVNQRVSAESQAIQTAYEALRTNAVNMAEALGLSSDAVKTFTTTLGTDITQNDIGTRGIKLDGLTPEEAAQKVQAALNQANEDLAAFVLGASRTVTETITTSVEDWAEGEQGRWMRGYVDQVSQVSRTIEATGPSFARTGETAVQTLTRLASSISTINPVLELLGLQLFDTSLAGAELASTMADAFGGLENFTRVTAQYYQEFFSEAERTAHVTAQLTEALGGMGMTLPTTRDAFRDLVEAQDLTTEAGRKNFATLMQLSGTFAAITPVLEQVTEAGETVTETLRSAADILNERQGLERQLLQLQGDTTALRALERAALHESNRARYDEITALQDSQAAAAAAAQAQRDYTAAVEAAQAAVERARSAVASAESGVAAVREQATSAYISAQDRVAAANARIADLNAGIANAARDAALRVQELGTSLQEFVHGQFATPSQNFGTLLRRALGGDSEAMQGLPEAARAAIDVSRASARTTAQAAMERARILSSVAEVAAVAAATALPEGAAAADPMLQATQELAAAQAELVSALGVANQLGAPLTREVQDLVAKFTAAQGALTLATTDLAAAEKALADIVANTAGTVTAVNSATTAIGTLKTAFDTAKNTLDVQLKAVADSNLPDDIKTLIADKGKTYQVTIGAVMASTLTDAQKTLLLEASTTGMRAVTLGAAFGTALTAEQRQALMVADETILRTIQAAVTAGTLTDEQRLLLTMQKGTVDRTVNALVNSASLTTEQRAFLNLVTGATATGATVTISGAVTFDPGNALQSIFNNISKSNALLAKMALAQLGPTATAQQKATTYGAFRELYTDAQTRAIVETAYGRQTDADWAVLKSLAGFANGGVFTNGIVSQPTLFNMAQMGEAGPEAIMPLSRGADGSLGVNLWGSGARRDEALVAEIRALRQEMTELRAEARSTAVATNKTARILDRVTPDGNSLQTVAAV